MILLILTISIQAQIKFPEYLIHANTTKPLVDQNQIKGTVWSVVDKAARNVIPFDKRHVGMLVSWIENSLYTTKRFQGTTALDVNWTNDANWTNIVDTSSPIDSINFKSITKTGSHKEGNLIYDTNTKSLSFQNDIIGFNHNLGYESVLRVYNESGATILNGKFCRIIGSFKDGNKITAKVAMAGNGRQDSAISLGVATTNILNNTYGVITLNGEVKGLNTSGYLFGDLIYLNHSGLITKIKPEAPLYSVIVGLVLNADNDSGIIYVNPELPIINPHFHVDTSLIAKVITITTSNVYVKLPVSVPQIRDNEGFLLVGDSVQVLVSGHYIIDLGMSFNGNPATEEWRYGVFINGKPIYTKSRTTTSNGTGDISVKCYRKLTKNQWISFAIMNQGGTGDPEVRDINFNIHFQHE